MVLYVIRNSQQVSNNEYFIDVESLILQFFSVVLCVFLACTLIIAGMSLMLYACEMVPKLKTRQIGSGITSQVSSNSGIGGGKTNKKKKR